MKVKLLNLRREETKKQIRTKNQHIKIKVATSPPGVRTLFRSTSKSNMITSDSISSVYLLAFDTSASIYPFSSDLWPPTDSSWIIHRYNPTPQHQCPRNLFGSFIGRRWRAIKHRTLDPRRSGSQKVDPMIPQTGYIWSDRLQLEKPRVIHAWVKPL